ncbi:MAG: DUF5011 domain-containing protein, partial [Candidatus Neomarinimicrobiota bacterium]
MIWKQALALALFIAVPLMGAFPNVALDSYNFGVKVINGDAADIDHDGDLDFLTSQSYSSHLHFTRNDGANGLVNYYFTNYANDGKFIDFNGDGYADIVNLYNYGPVGTYGLQFRQNNQAGSFTHIATMSTTDLGSSLNSLNSIAVADYDNDGDQDLLLAGSRFNQNAIVLQNDGNGNFTEAYKGGWGNGQTNDANEAMWADFNNDGMLDFAILIQSWNANQPLPMVWQNTGSGFQPAYTEPAPGVGLFTRDGSVADLDGDGDMDIVAQGNLANGFQGVLVYENLGNFNFTRHQIYDQTGMTLGGVRVGDFDNDNDMDLVTTTGIAWDGTNPQRLELLENLGGLNFSPGWEGATTTGTLATVINSISWVGDAEGDGDLEVLTGEYYAGFLWGFNSPPPAINTPPVANAGPDQSVSATNGSASVTLDGSASSDADGDPLTYSWSEGGNQIATGVSPTITLGWGYHDITLTVSDGTDTATDMVSVSVLHSLDPTALGRTPWEMHSGLEEANGYPFGVIPFNSGGHQHGWDGEYAVATIPGAVDPGWGPAPDGNTIGFYGEGAPGTPSLIDDAGYGCQTAVDFTYFQTFVNIPANMTVTQFSIAFNGMDDGSRITIYNSNYPDGVVDPGSYVYLWGSGTADLSGYVAPGENRVVVTQVDDCPGGNTLAYAQVTLNGASVSYNSPPIANAGMDQSAECSSSFTLDGSGSSDPDGDALTYSWVRNGVLLVNGSFENGMTGWTHTGVSGAGGNSIDRGSWGNATDGSWLIDLVGTGNYAPPGAVEQTISTDVGADYVLSFDIIVNGVPSLVVTIDGGAPQTFSATGSYSIAFTATSGSTTIRLSSDGSYPYVGNNLFLDNVSVSGGQINSVSFTTGTLPVGSYTYTLTVSDGEFTSTDEVVVSVAADATAPVITLGGSNPLVMFRAASYTDPGATASDACDPNPVLTVSGTVDPTTLGSYTVTYTATDASGNSSTATRTVQVINQIPVAVAGQPQSFDCVLTTQQVQLDGSGSSDPDGDALSYSWTEGATPLASGAQPLLSLGVGVHTLTLTVDDGFGGSATDQVVITVNGDVDPPVLTLTGPNPIETICLYGYTDPGFTVADNCDLNPTVAMTTTVDTSA